MLTLILRIVTLILMVKPSARGFTLIELLVVISIITVLGAIGAVTYSTTQKTSRISKRVQDLKALGDALELYKLSTGKYPKYDVLFGGSTVCFGNIPPNPPDPSFTPTYMPVVPADPLDAGNNITGTSCYQYRSSLDQTEYKIRTNPSLTTASTNNEMSSNDFKQQPSLIDPASDGGYDCTVDLTGTITRWAIYVGTVGCQY